MLKSGKCIYKKKRFISVSIWYTAVVAIAVVWFMYEENKKQESSRLN